MTTPDAPATSDAPSSGSGSGRSFRRVLLKLSGEAFCAPGGFGIDAEELGVIAEEVRSALEIGAQVAIVVGGGNIIRGATLAKSGDIHQATADYMGMLGTVMNAAALREKLQRMGITAHVMSALEIRALAEAFIRRQAIEHLESGAVVVLAAGIGNPYFTTDSAAALRAIELDCDALLKATKVDGVYTADPKTDPTATRYERLTFREALDKRLRVMDMTALTVCQENALPVLVFDFKKPGNIRRVIAGESIGTLLTGS